MSRPRPVHAGKSYMVTRRCIERYFLLTPSDIVNQIVTYAFAYGQRKYGILIHTIGVMSNHLHSTVSDPYGNLPLFHRDTHAMMARLINAHWGRKGPVFEAKQTHRLELEPETFITWASYTIANPVSAGLVESHHDWPGLVSTTLTQKIRAKRPDFYFDPNTELPDELELVLTPPPMMEQTSLETLQMQLDAAVEERIRLKKAEMAAKNQEFVGREEVLRTPPTTQATSPEPRIGAIPKVAMADRKRRNEWFKELKAWERNYGEAFAEWRSGGRDVVFPSGTWHLHVHHGARRAESGQI